MGRPPIGNKAMTAAERQRKRRARLANEGAVEWRPEYRPARTIADQHHNEFLNHLFLWLEYGDINEVTEFLADAFSARSTDEPALPPLITKRMEEMEREAVAAEEAREALAQRYINGTMTVEEIQRALREDTDAGHR